jgi:hypothetical protein
MGIKPAKHCYWLWSPVVPINCNKCHHNTYIYACMYTTYLSSFTIICAYTYSTYLQVNKNVSLSSVIWFHILKQWKGLYENVSEMAVFLSCGLLNYTTFEGNNLSSIPFTIFQLFTKVWVGIIQDWLIGLMFCRANSQDWLIGLMFCRANSWEWCTIIFLLMSCDSSWKMQLYKYKITCGSCTIGM